MLEPESFDVQKKAKAPIIVMLDCSEVGIEVLDIGMKSVRFSEYREVLRVDRVANSVLATTHDKP